MSVEVFVAALEARIPPDPNAKTRAGVPALKAVLLGLANHAGPDGRHAYPSVRRLVAYTGLSDTTVRGALAVLRDLDIAWVAHPATAQRPTDYSINVNLLRHLKDPALLDLDHDLPEGPPDVGGATPPGAGGVREPEASGSPADPSGIRRSPLREPEASPPGAGGEPSYNRSSNRPLEPLAVGKNSNGNDQTPLVQALAAILTNGDRAFKAPGGVYHRYFEPVVLVGLSPGELVLRCDSDDQAAWLEDRGERTFAHAFAGVLGRSVVVRFIGPDEPVPDLLQF